MRTGWLRPMLEALLGFVAVLVAVTGRVGAGSRRAVRSREQLSRGWSAAGLSEGPGSRRWLLADDGVDDETRVALASAWNDAALEAHGALAKSTERALDLATLCAPPDLVARAHEDALDDIRRVKVCFGLARGLDGRSALPAGGAPRRALPRVRSAALALLATEMVVEVALAESRASRMHARLARRTTDRTIRAALEELAASEARRVADAWALVRWCVAEGGPSVEHALRALGSRLPPPERILPREALDGGWERWGIAGAALERQAHAHACELVERNIHELVSSVSGRGRLAAA